MASGTRGGRGRGTDGSEGVEIALDLDREHTERCARALKDGRKAVTLGRLLKGGTSLERRGFWFLWEGHIEGIVYEHFGTWEQAWRAYLNGGGEVDPTVDTMFLQLIRSGVTGDAQDYLENEIRSRRLKSGVMALKLLREWAIQTSRVDLWDGLINLMKFLGKEFPSRGDPRPILNSFIREWENHQSIYGIKVDENVIMASIYNALPDTYSQLKYSSK